jgi:hypothetical protein
LKQEGRWPTQQLRIRDRKSTNRQLTSAKAALLSSAVGLKQSRHRFAVTEAAQEHTFDAVRGGWPWTAFDFQL